MRFARIVFTVAGIWGVAVLALLYWLVDLTGHPYAPPTDYPQFFYGFLSVAMAWQIAFLVIVSNPARLRPLMVAAVIEKLGFVLTVVVLHGQARLSSRDTHDNPSCLNSRASRKNARARRIGSSITLFPKFLDRPGIRKPCSNLLCFA